MNTLNKNELHLSDTELLNYCFENGIVNLDDVQKQIMKKRNESYLQLHNQQHKLWFDKKANQWMTYIDEPSAKRGFVLKRRKSKEDLENLIVEHYNAIENKPRIENLFREWIDSKCEYNEITPQTKTRYENDFKRFFSKDNPITQLYVSEITEFDLESFIKGCIKNFHLTRKTYGGLIILIRGMFKYAKKRNYTSISINLFLSDLDLPKRIFCTPAKKNDEDEVYNEEEIQLLKQYLLQKNSLRELGVLLVFWSGLRVGELAGLKPEDIITHDSHKSLHIQRTEVHYSKPDENGKLRNVVEIQNFTKTDAGERYVLLNSFGAEVLNRICALNPQPQNYLFEENGKRIKIRGFSGALRRACKALNLPFRPMHKVRKTYGTTLIDNNVSEALIAKQMGHADIATTKKYYYFNNQNESHKFQDIERALSAI